MTRLPVVKSHVMEKVLFNLGFMLVRQKGSHAFYRHPDGRTTTLPKHEGRDLARSLIRTILREIELSIDDFIKEINK